MEKYINKIIKGDCIELLKKIPDNSIDLIFADPPYNLQLNGDLFRPNQSKVSAVNDEWDKFSSFNEYDDFTEKWLKECQRVLKKNGAIWVIGSYHNIFRVGKIIQDLGYWIMNDIVWVKNNPMPNFKGTRFNNAHETLIWATKSENSKPTFHYKAMKSYNEDKQMRSDWNISICSGNERLKSNGEKAHSTQKPEELLYRIILSTSNPGDIILDPFMGSGTTGAIAKKLGRKFIGFEKEEKYIKVANERIKKVKPIQLDNLEYKIEQKQPKVPFGFLIESNMIKIGEFLFSKDKKIKAKVQADSTLIYNDMVGSIHKVSAKIANKESSNGWGFWFVERNGKMELIDEIRNKYIKKFLQ